MSNSLILKPILSQWNFIHLRNPNILQEWYCFYFDLKQGLVHFVQRVVQHHSPIAFICINTVAEDLTRDQLWTVMNP